MISWNFPGNIPEVTLGCKVGDVIEMMGNEWRIEDVIF